MCSSRGSGCEGAGLGDEAPETGAAVVGQVDGEGCHCGEAEVGIARDFNHVLLYGIDREDGAPSCE